MYDSKHELFISMIPLFKPLCYAPLFLNPVVNGEYPKVQELLGINIHFLTLNGSITDCSGRVFSNISGFEYALWAKDKHMWSLMLDFVRQIPFDARIVLVNQLLAQYKKLINEGISYTLNGYLTTERHFDFGGTIIHALYTQVAAHKAPGQKDWAALSAQWKAGVGGAQKLLPMHVVYEYCSATPFSSTSDFINAPLMLNRQFYVGDGCKDCKDWFAPASKLAVDFAIVKGLRKAGWAECAKWAGMAWGADRDLAALETLCKVRTADFNKLEEQLEVLLQADCQPINFGTAPHGL